MFHSFIHSYLIAVGAYNSLSHKHSVEYSSIGCTDMSGDGSFMKRVVSGHVTSQPQVASFWPQRLQHLDISSQRSAVGWPATHG